MRFIPNTDKERQEMLQKIGVKNFDALLSPIPEHLRLKAPLNLPSSLSELEIKKLMQGIANKNASTDKYISFLGAGSYDHYIPAIVDYVCQRPEFYTAYTPYQAELSQGTLQVIYEYQSMICELTGMEVSNASMYDGATALAEACYMAKSITGKKEILISDSVNPNYIKCCETYLGKVTVIPTKNGTTDIEALKNIFAQHSGRCGPVFCGIPSWRESPDPHMQDIACMVIQEPNFFGILEPVQEIEAIVHKNQAIYIGIPLPISLGVLTPPGNWGADIVVAEGQGLGIPQSFGGPGLGILASKKEWLRKMPGRIIGKTIDTEARQGFVMTAQTREQHIKREKATSNICTNEGLCAIAACVYLTIMGPQGLKEVSELCYHKAHYLADRISQIPGFRLVYDAPFFNEFLVHMPVPAEKIVQDLIKEGIFAGVPMSKVYAGQGTPAKTGSRRKRDRTYPDCHSERSEESLLLIAVTEKRTKEEMDYFVEKLKK
ncbi:MAG: glycine dehydrogenase [Candidatus Stahlbacteria bacterium]|nr:glycine dehydrogenase [Candidatus Stahlbacteria bacterium]